MRHFQSWPQMQVGDTVTFYRTFTEGDVSNFIGVTGDFNPIHLDGETARLCGFKDRIVPGLLTAGMLTHAGGTLLPEPYPAGKMWFKFLAPVYIGETICAKVLVKEKDPQKNRLTLHITCFNPQNEIVLEGEVAGKIMPVLGQREQL